MKLLETVLSALEGRLPDLDASKIRLACGLSKVSQESNPKASNAGIVLGAVNKRQLQLKIEAVTCIRTESCNQSEVLTPIECRLLPESA